MCHVRAVVEQNDNVRAPAAEERNEDNEHRFHLTHGLHPCSVTGLTRHL